MENKNAPKVVKHAVTLPTCNATVSDIADPTKCPNPTRRFCTPDHNLTKYCATSSTSASKPKK